MFDRALSNATNAHLLAELVHRIGQQPGTKAGGELYNTLREVQKLEKADREAREAAVKAAAREAARAIDAKAAAAAAKPLPCPWCGMQAESFEAMRKWVGLGGFQYSCKNCSASRSMARTESEAQLAWNTRNGKPQDRRQSGERRVASEEAKLNYNRAMPWSSLHRRLKQRRAADRPE